MQSLWKSHHLFGNSKVLKDLDVLQRNTYFLQDRDNRETFEIDEIKRSYWGTAQFMPTRIKWLPKMKEWYSFEEVRYNKNILKYSHIGINTECFWGLKRHPSQKKLLVVLGNHKIRIVVQFA